MSPYPIQPTGEAEKPAARDAKHDWIYRNDYGAPLGDALHAKCTKCWLLARNVHEGNKLYPACPGNKELQHAHTTGSKQ